MPEPAATLHTLSASRAREAELLADMLRISRLTILYGEAGVGKTTLLLTGVMPLLGRRIADRALPQMGESRVVVPFPKCRRRDRSVRAEVAVFFDAWNDAPLATLNEQLLAALRRERADLAAPHPRLSDNLTSWSTDLGVRFLILFDRFEEYLTAPRDRPGIAEFTEEFLVMLQNPQLPANFLVSVQEYAEPLMERLRARVRGMGDASLRLDPLAKRAPATVQSLHEHEHARARRAHLHQPLEGSAGEPQAAIAAPEIADTVDTPSAETLTGSEAARETNGEALEAAQYDWTATSSVTQEAIAYSGPQNIWASFGTAEHEWTLAFQLAAQNTAAPREPSRAEETAAVAKPPPEAAGVSEFKREAAAGASNPRPEEVPGLSESIAEDVASASESRPEDVASASESRPEVAPVSDSMPEEPSSELRADAEASSSAALEVPEADHRPVPETVASGEPVEIGAPAESFVPEPAPNDIVASGEPVTSGEPEAVAVPAEPRVDEEVPIETVATGEAPALRRTANDEPLPAPTQSGVLLPSTIAGKRRLSRAKWLAAAGAVTSIAVAVWIAQNVPLERLPAFISGDAAKGEPVPEPTQAAPPPEPIMPPLPQIALVTEPGNSTDAQIAGDLARFTAADRAVNVTYRADMPSWPDDGAARLAILRYEALDAANRTRERTGKGSDRLRVVTPLYTEEIHIIARRDSPLNFIHEIADAKLNVGPSTASRGLTAARLYQRMFGKSMPQANVSSWSDDEALNRLVNEKSIDAMIVIAGQPSAWLAEMPPQLASSIKLLKHDRSHPAGQRAIEAYLPTTIRARSYGKWLSENTPALATMTFLVASEGGNAEALERFDLFAQSFCRNLDRLRVEGHPKWREVQLGFEIDTGWPYSERAKSAFQACLAQTRSAAAPGPR